MIATPLICMLQAPHASPHCSWRSVILSIRFFRDTCIVRSAGKNEVEGTGWELLGGGVVGENTCLSWGAYMGGGRSAG